MSSKAEHYKRYQKRKSIQARMSRSAQDRNPDSLRNRLGGIGWCSKADMITAIQEAMLCDRERAEKRFTVAKVAKIIKYDKGANMWATAGIAEHHDPPKPRAIRTPRHQEHWDKWSFVPDIPNDRDMNKSELHKHQVSAGVFPDIAASHTEYHRANNGTRVDELKPTCVIRLDGRKVVHGKNRYRPGTFRHMRELKWDEAVEACRSRYPELIAVPEKKLTGFEPEKLVGQAIACGDLVATNIKPDPFYPGWQSFILIGADRLAKIHKEEAERIAQEEAQRLADEATRAELARRKEQEQKEAAEHRAKEEAERQARIKAQQAASRLALELAQKQELIDYELPMWRTAFEREDLPVRRLVSHMPSGDDECTVKWITENLSFTFMRHTFKVSSPEMARSVRQLAIDMGLAQRDGDHYRVVNDEPLKAAA